MNLHRVNKVYAWYDSTITLSGLTQDQIDKIKKDLTFDNPTYATTQRYSRYAYTTVPPYLTYYKEWKKSIEVPIGYDLSQFKSLQVEDTRVYKKLDNIAPFVLELRDSQKEAAESYLNSNINNPTLKGSIQMPTGKGKSILGLYLASALSAKTLVVVHKDDLVSGWQKDIALAFDGKVNPGLIKAKSRRIGHFITIATVQTLNRLPAEELNDLFSQFGFVIQDEMHHCILGDSLILKDDGGVLPITNIKNSDSLYGGTATNSFSLNSEVYCLSFKHGIIEGSPDHLTFCIDKRKYFNKHLGQYDFSNAEFEVKHLSELDNNYVVPVLRKIPHTVNNNLSKEEASFAALIMCDGHLDRSGNRVKVNVSKDKKFYESLFSSYLDSYKSNNDCRGNLTLWTTEKIVKSCLMNKWKIPTGKKSTLISIPEFLYYAPLDSIKAFIETCFSCEGNLSNTNDNYRIHFTTCSKSFAQGLSLLLRKFGIVPNFQVISNSGKHSTAYRLTCSGGMFNMFMDTFSIMPRKTTSNRNSGNLNKNRVHGDYILSDVKKVEDLGYTDMVYDFEVPESHSFIANGALTHNCPASSFEVVSKFRARYKLGLTATPERTDGLTHVMNLYFGDFCYRYKHDANDKDILPAKVIVRKSDLYFNPLCEEKRLRDRVSYKIKDLAYPQCKTLSEGQIRLSDISYNNRPKVPFQVIDDFVVRGIKEFVCEDIIREYDKGHSCIVFFTQKEHCRLYYDYLLESVSPDHLGLYYGDNKDNDAVLEKAEKTRKFITLTTYAKATEGTNVKQWEVEFLVSSINNEKNTEQAVGRVRRTKDGKKISPVLIYDYRTPNAYSVSSHGKTRDARYRQLRFEVEGVKRSSGLFSRGYK